MRWKHALAGLGVALSFGCLRFPDAGAFMALDYRIDRARVVAIKVSPPVLVHGVPVTVEPLLLAPADFQPDTVSADICGLEEDVLVEVWSEACFKEAELVDNLAKEVPFTWNPPDLRDIPCLAVDDTGFPDTGEARRDETDPPDTDPPDTDPADTDPSDTDVPIDTGEPPFAEERCVSLVPLMIGYQDGDVRAYGEVWASIRVTPLAAGEPIPQGIDAVPRSIEVIGEVAAGAEVEIVFRVDAEPSGFRWWIDDGELVGTGRTTIQEREGETRITRNKLRIPADWHGPLRVFVVTEAGNSWKGHTGDLTWSSVTLEVP